MTADQQFINEVMLLRAHASETVIIADNLLKRFDVKKKKSGLSDSGKAKLLAGRERTRLKHPSTKALF